MTELDHPHKNVVNKSVGDHHGMMRLFMTPARHVSSRHPLLSFTVLLVILCAAIFYALFPMLVSSSHDDVGQIDQQALPVLKTVTQFSPVDTQNIDIRLVKPLHQKLEITKVDLRRGIAMQSRQIFELRGVAANHEDYDILMPHLRFVAYDEMGQQIKSVFLDLPMDVLQQDQRRGFAHRIFMEDMPARVTIAIQGEPYHH